MSSYNGIRSYILCNDFKERKADLLKKKENIIFDLEEKRLKNLEAMGETGYKKIAAVQASTKTFRDFYLLAGIVLPACILYKRYTSH